MGRHDLFIDKWIVFLGVTAPSGTHINPDYLVYCLRYKGLDGKNPYLNDSQLVELEAEFKLLTKPVNPFPERSVSF